MNILQHEATLGEYWFSFAFFNVVIFLAYLCAGDNQNRKIIWLFALLFCVYAFWDTDYYSFRYIFQHPKTTFRDPLYYYLTFFSFGSYSIYRLIIWGSALLLFQKTCSRFEVDKNLSAYVFVIFFLLTFSFARASLGMALYFYGLSYLLKPNQFNKTNSYLWGIIFILLSYFGHRSMLLIIAMTPLAFIQLSKTRILILFCLFPLLVLSVKIVLLYFVTSSSTIDGQLEGFSKAVRSYATIRDFELNWKFKLITILRNASHYILCFYLLWVVWLKKRDEQIPQYIKGFVTMSVMISCVAAALSLAGVGIASVTSKRYLYMLGIPICISLAYTVQNEICSWRHLNRSLLVSLLWAEGFFIGKIMSFY